MGDPYYIKETWKNLKWGEGSYIGENIKAEDYHEDHLDKELQLEFLANGDDEERKFRDDFMNIVNGWNHINGNAYEAIEWAIAKIRNMKDVWTLPIDNYEFLINDEKQVAMFPYSIAKESKFFINQPLIKCL